MDPDEIATVTKGLQKGRLDEIATAMGFHAGAGVGSGAGQGSGSQNRNR